MISKQRQASCLCGWILFLSVAFTGCRTISEATRLQVLDQFQRPIEKASVYYYSPEISELTSNAFSDDSESLLLQKTNQRGMATVTVPQKPGFLYVSYQSEENQRWPVREHKATIVENGIVRFEIHRDVVLKKPIQIESPSSFSDQSSLEGLLKFEAESIQPDFTDFGQIVITPDSDPPQDE